MKLLLLKDLVEQGISPTEVQQSLTLTCFTKTFRRQSDLPKKFKEKAVNLCKEMNQLGKETFILETNYSYTVWVEEQGIKEKKKSQDSSSQANQNLSVSSSVENNTELEVYTLPIEEKVIDSKQTFTMTEYNLFDIASSNNFERNRRQNQEEKQMSSASKEITDEVKTYRGVVLNQSVKTQPVIEETSPLKQKVKPRTYRGITY
ncbi:hypothetical protein [Geminocystis sp. NIES-3709]|uniref:hypothetical protein n=1 Tax=Geminocystis sp. NIES-3709 TaxID=1617448 RepID=UPI0005FC9A6C|nr:hypothetical protein [Geminocystis sp. NIES-3709]BAQ63316.1 hypothetical protein GM3709_81 [Geminocystis sp. NIES-3709]